MTPVPTMVNFSVYITRQMDNELLVMKNQQLGKSKNLLVRQLLAYGLKEWREGRLVFE